MRFLVTGGGGFLGLYIVEQLLAAGHSVRVFCRGTYPTLNRDGIETLRGDIRSSAAVSAACKNMDAVFHTAAVPGVWGSWQKYHGINTLGTLNVIDGCRQHDVRRLVYTSSPSVVFDGGDHLDGDESLPYPTTWMCHYPHSKALAEQAVLKANSTELRTVSLRPHLIWGPRDNHLIPRLLQKQKSGRLKRVGDGRNVVSVSYVENAAAAHLQAEQSLRNGETAAGRAYFINEPKAVNLWHWIDEILAMAELPAVRGQVSRRTAERIGGLMEMMWKLLPGEPPMTRFVARQLAGSHSYSVQAAQRDFGYTAVCNFEEAMKRLKQSMKVED